MIWNTPEGREDYLRDESRCNGRCEGICIPETDSKLLQALTCCLEEGIQVTFQGGRTGIAGAAVPDGGRVISTELLSQCTLEGNRMTALCGTRLQDIQAAARAAHLRFAPNPTEESATIGGAFACAAAGPNCLRYGDVSQHILGVSLLLPCGTQWELERGQYCFDQTGCPLPGGGRLELNVVLPPAGTPRWGFAPVQGMDLLDLFCGSEGTLALFERFQLKLSPVPDQTWGVLFFFEDENSALGFAGAMSASALSGGVITTVEFLDSDTISLILTLKESSTQLSALPRFPERRGGAVFMELEFSQSESPDEALMFCLEQFGLWGGQDQDTWAVSSPADLDRLHLLRHAAAEAVNFRLNHCRRALPELSKLCGAFQTDLAHMPQAAAMYWDGLDRTGISGAVFGHASIGRLHVNLLPETKEQLSTATQLLEQWAEQITQWGGHALAENGCGKTHLNRLARLAPPEQLSLMAQVKAYFDPAGLLGPGTLRFR